MTEINLAKYILIRETKEGEIVVFTNLAQWIPYRPIENANKWKFWDTQHEAEKALRKLHKFAIVRPYML